jgi:hypothetical protein
MRLGFKDFFDASLILYTVNMNRNEALQRKSIEIARKWMDIATFYLLAADNTACLLLADLPVFLSYISYRNICEADISVLWAFPSGFLTQFKIFLMLSSDLCFFQFLAVSSSSPIVGRRLKWLFQSIYSEALLFCSNLYIYLNEDTQENFKNPQRLLS